MTRPEIAWRAPIFNAFQYIRTETSWLRSAASVLNNVYYIQTLLFKREKVTEAER